MRCGRLQGGGDRGGWWLAQVGDGECGMGVVASLHGYNERGSVWTRAVGVGGSGRKWGSFGVRARTELGRSWRHAAAVSTGDMDSPVHLIISYQRFYCPGRHTRSRCHCILVT
jgi:hypothetical protein